MSGDDIMVPSIFTEKEDRKLKLGINSRTGIYHCFKTGERGNFVRLYSKIEKIPYYLAEIKLLVKNLDNFNLEVLKNKPNTSPFLENVSISSFIPVTLHSHDSKDQLVLDAWTYLYKRKLFNLTDFESTIYYVSKDKDYNNRLIIPFKKNGLIFFFQARALYNQHPKYLTVKSKNSMLKSTNILYPFSMNEKYVLICEGPIDAISLQLEGINATSVMGCYTSEIQMETLKSFNGEIIVGFDNDSAGQKGIKSFDTMRKKKRLQKFNVCHPPEKFKDWAEVHEKGGLDIKKYIQENKYEYNLENIIKKFTLTS